MFDVSVPAIGRHMLSNPWCVRSVGIEAAQLPRGGNMREALAKAGTCCGACMEAIGCMEVGVCGLWPSPNGWPQLAGLCMEPASGRDGEGRGMEGLPGQAAAPGEAMDMPDGGPCVVWNGECTCDGSWPP